MANNTSFTMYRGDTKEFSIKYPYDITGARFALTVKEDIEDQNSEAIISISKIVGADAADDAVNGLVILTIPSTESSKLSPATYQMGIVKIIDGITPIVNTFFVGELKVLADVLQN